MRMNRRQVMKGLFSAAGAVAAPRLLSADLTVSGDLLAGDPNRPQIHLLPPANWMNDPNGPIFWKGTYHMFYQYNPDGAYWGDMHWGHAVSPDMVHWKHLPLALSPTPNSADAAGCFSGSAVIVDGRVSLLYTGIAPAPPEDATIRSSTLIAHESQCLATALDDNLTQWRKDPVPVIAGPPRDLDLAGFRDPCPWRQGDRWYMAVGSGIRGQQAMVLLYESSDLRHWTYVHPLTSDTDFDRPEAGGHMWECPDFFPLGDRHILIHSAQGEAWWQCGVFDPRELRFHVETGGQLDYGSYYAPKTQLDRSGNRILWGWIQERRSEAEYRKAGWAGVMSLPRVLSLGSDHRLQFDLPTTVDSLRRDLRQAKLAADPAPRLAQIANLRIRDGCGELLCTFRSGPTPTRISLVASTPGSAPLLSCRYDPAHPATFMIDDTAVPLRSAGAGTVHLRCLIDGSVIEIFVNRETVCTRRVYSNGSAAPVIQVLVDEGLMNVTEISTAQLAPISPNRLTT